MNFDTQAFVDALLSPGMMRGAMITIALTVITLVVASLIGMGLAIARTNPRSRLLRSLAAGYIWVFRAVPTLLWLLVFWNALPQVFPALKEDWYTPFIAGAIAFSLSEGAYMAEILRSALLAIDPGQRRAARALGFRPSAIMRKIVLPQMVRIAIPPTANELITVLKLTSLAFVISLQELMTVTQQGVSATFKFAEWYAASAIYYLIIVSFFMVLQARLERRYEWVSKNGTRSSSIFRKMVMLRGDT